MKNLFTTSLPLLALGVAAATAEAAAQQPQWQSVRLGGGGGFVPGIVFHPKTKGIAYARTDIGGLYRLNPADDSWTALTDSITDHAGWHNWGIDAVALDPRDDSKVYAAFGLYTNDWDPTRGQIGRSADRGKTWSMADLPFKVGGNMPGRGMGSGSPSTRRIPTSCSLGPGRGTGSGSRRMQGPVSARWTRSPPWGLNGATSRIFVGTADNRTASLYMSEDAGATWTALPGQPGKFFPHKGVFSAAEKALYISYADGTGPYDGTAGAVYRYDIASKKFTDITPGIGGMRLRSGSGAVDRRPEARGRRRGELELVVARCAYFPVDGLRGDVESVVGVGELSGDEDAVDKAPWIAPGFLDNDTKHLGWMIESLEIDPHDRDHWLYGTGLTLFGGHDLTKWDLQSWDAKDRLTISSLADGIEETSVQDVASVSGGSELLAATGDVGGFTFADASTLGQAPKVNWMGTSWTTNVGVDFAGSSKKEAVRIGNSAGTKQIAVSADGGATWAPHEGADTTANGGTVAMSADGKVIVWSASSGGVIRSEGKDAFTKVASLPVGAIVASDKQNATVFYGASGSKFYVSKDAGASFGAATGDRLFGGATAVRDIAAHPNKAGDVWVSTDAGVFHSTDYGATFAQTASSLKNTFQVALGVGGKDKKEGLWNVYAFGHGAAGARLYGSADGGKSWVDVQGGEQGFGTVDSGKLAGSGNVPGLVYVGTNGRGVFRSTVSL
ncbi:xylosidase/arabinosidase [Apiospora sp. TS-2023a]